MLISIHAPHTGRDAVCFLAADDVSHFNPRAPYGARQPRKPGQHKNKGISIHAPHTGRDECSRQIFSRINISIHAPHTGRDKQERI